MAINDFKNIENINLNLASTAQLLDSKDLTIFKTGAKNITDFGMSENDVIEFRVYDLGNNLLEQTDYGNVRYIAKQDLPKYLISEPDQQTGESILTIDVETLLNEGGFGNGEFNVIINFLKNYVGTNNTKQRVWIHEVSPSRNEIRIVPLAGDDKVQHRYNAFMDDGVEFKDNVNVIVNAIDAAQTMISDSIDNYLKQQYGEGWLKSIRNDFKLGTDAQYTALKNNIFATFKKNVFTDLSKLDKNEFYGNTELSNIITNNIQLAVELLTKDLVYVEYPQVVKQALQQNQDNQILQSLLDTNIVTKSNLTQLDKLKIIANTGSISQPLVDTTPQPTASVIYTPTPAIQTPAPELPSNVIGGGNEGVISGGGGSTNANTGMNYLNDAINWIQNGAQDTHFE